MSISQAPTPLVHPQLFHLQECRRVLAAQSESTCQPHVCGDIMERISPVVRSQLKDLRESSAKKLEAKLEKVADCDRGKWVAHFNKLFLDQACQLLKSVRFTREDMGYCYRCNSRIRLHPPASSAKVLVNISGSTCVAWSGMSQNAPSELGWLHASAEPCLVWLHEQASLKNHYIVHECVRGFDAEVFKRVLGDSWHVSTVRFSAKMIGVPVDRTRAYTVACSQPERCQLPFTMDLVKKTLYHNLNSDCSIFLQASDELTMQHREALAPVSVRHLALKKRYRTSALLTAGDSHRLEQWRRAIEKKSEAAADDMKNIVRRHFVNVCQEPSYMSLPKHVVVPALLRGSKLFSVDADRWIHPSELLSIQGVPMFLGDQHAFTSISPFSRVHVSLRTMTQMAGNAMHVGVVGGVLLLVVASYSQPEGVMVAT